MDRSARSDSDLAGDIALAAGKLCGLVQCSRQKRAALHLAAFGRYMNANGRRGLAERSAGFPEVQQALYQGVAVAPGYGAFGLSESEVSRPGT